MSGTTKGALARSLFASALLLLAAGCAKEVVVRGNLPDPDTLASIQPGAVNKLQVQELLGSPSTVSSFQDGTWYYIGHKEQQTAFLDPTVLERTVFVVDFNDADIVTQTAHYTLEDGRIIDPVSRQTPTEGREITLLQQLFGNLGRFPAAGDNSSSSATSGATSPFGMTNGSR